MDMDFFWRVMIGFGFAIGGTGLFAYLLLSSVSAFIEGFGSAAKLIENQYSLKDEEREGE